MLEKIVKSGWKNKALLAIGLATIVAGGAYHKRQKIHSLYTRAFTNQAYLATYDIGQRVQSCGSKTAPAELTKAGPLTQTYHFVPLNEIQEVKDVLEAYENRFREWLERELETKMPKINYHFPQSEDVVASGSESVNVNVYKRIVKEVDGTTSRTSYCKFNFGDGRLRVAVGLEHAANTLPAEILHAMAYRQCKIQQESIIIDNQRFTQAMEGGVHGICLRMFEDFGLNVTQMHPPLEKPLDEQPSGIYRHITLYFLMSGTNKDRWNTMMEHLKKSIIQQKRPDTGF